MKKGKIGNSNFIFMVDTETGFITKYLEDTFWKKSGLF